LPRARRVQQRRWLNFWLPEAQLFARRIKIRQEAPGVRQGLYEDDLLGNLGRLELELMRAARLVVDTGLSV